MRHLITFCLLIFSVTALPTVAEAHFMWLNPRTYAFMPGESLQMTLGWGHSFPGQGGDFLPQERLKEAFALSPSGQKISLSASKISIIFNAQTAFEEEGSYLLAAQRKAGFFTKTTSGYKRQSKKGLKGVIECKFSRGYAKAIVSVGKAGGEVYRKVLGHELEIVPLKDPNILRPGDYLPIQVTFKGKPLAKHFVYATYAGFSPTGETDFAYATETDSQGRAQIRLDRRGVWLIVVRYRTHYPDSQVCDLYKVVSTLTFELR